MSLDDLYRETILDHYSHPRNKGALPGADVTGEGANPLCGDEIRIFLMVRDGLVQDVQFDGKGCSISQASASMMTELIKGKAIEEAHRLIASFKEMIRGAPAGEDLGDLEALQGVRRFPVRVKCATLGWVTLEGALKDLAPR